LAPEAVVELGYFNETLTAMERNPGQPVPNAVDPALRPAFFRRFNRRALTSDATGENRWETLVADMAEIVEHVRPSTVVVPHPQMDPHPDHGAATRALEAALRRAGHSPENTLYYTTHIRDTAEHPFGPPHCTAGPPPNFAASGVGLGYFSLPVSEETQRNKVSALEAMHDLRSSPRWEKRVKKWAQRLIAGRAWPEYGEHAYFRTAIKANEIFFVRRHGSASEVTR
jgi:LmbE family N-acetylglucosaminyl deacetylase